MILLRSYLDEEDRADSLELMPRPPKVQFVVGGTLGYCRPGWPRKDGPALLTDEYDHGKSMNVLLGWR